MRKGTSETCLFQAALANSAWIDFSKITPGGVHDASEIEQVISSFAMRAEGGIVVAPHAVTWANEDIIIDLALRHHLPTHYAATASIAAGGLVSYGHDFDDALRKTAEYVDRILRGEKPGDLPVQMPTKFRLVLNLKTAKAIGLKFHQLCSLAPTR